MRNKNKWLAVLLAGTLCGSNAVPVLAAGNNSEANPVSTETTLPAETPETEAPEAETPETEAPEAEAPETEVPETEAPGTETPETEAPETETPETAVPEGEGEETPANDGWVSENGQWYYYVDGEKLENCIYFVDGKWWLFSGYGGALSYNTENYVRKWGTDEWNTYRSSSDGSLVFGWYSDGEHWFFYDKEDGHRYSYQKFEDEGNLYYVNSNGWLLTSDWYVDDEGKTYWADSTGVLTEKSTSEWVFSDGYWYYYKDGVLLKSGLYVINGSTYYFDYFGKMATGSFYYRDNESGKSGYKLADENGQVITWGKDWQRVGDEYYFFEETGWIVTDQIKTISGKDYYFNYDGKMAKGYFSFNDNGVLKEWVTDDSGAISPSCKTGGWAQYDGNWFYFKAPYQLAKGEFLDIDGRTFYFDYNSHMVKGSIWVDGKNYFTDINGAIIKNQWFMQRDDWYCAKEDGSLYTDGVYEINGKKYYFNFSGAMQTGFVYVYDGQNGNTYVTDASGALITTQGWIEINSDWYYLNYEGKIAKSQWIGNYYYVNGNGVMVTGSQLVDDVYYYFDNSGYLIYDASSGKTGWQFNNGYWYYFNSDGKPVTGWVGSYYVENGRMVTNALIQNKDCEYAYYVGPTGAYVTNGWYFAKASAFEEYSNTRSADSFYSWIYADANGVLSKDTWEYINGNWYYFDHYSMCNWGPTEINGTTYWFSDDGVCLNPNGTGNLRGWTYMDDGWYYIKEDGSLLQEVDQSVINGTTYYFDYTGRMSSDTLKYDFTTHKMLYINSNGTAEEFSKGWNAFHNNWIYINEDGTCAEDIQSINGSYYYFDNGLMRTGLLYVDAWDGYYFFNASGAWQDVTRDGWYSDGYEWYYFRNGSPLKGVHTIDGATYYLNTYDGSMLIGENHGFLYGDNGARLYNSWYHDEYSGDWYYSDASGRIVKGEQNINGTTYWFNENGVWVK